MPHFNNTDSSRLVKVLNAFDWKYSLKHKGTAYLFLKSDSDKAKHAQAMLNLYSIPNTYEDAINYIYLFVHNEDVEPQYSLLMSLLSKD